MEGIFSEIKKPLWSWAGIGCYTARDAVSGHHTATTRPALSPKPQLYLKRTDSGKMGFDVCIQEGQFCQNAPLLYAKGGNRCSESQTFNYWLCTSGHHQKEADVALGHLESDPLALCPFLLWSTGDWPPAPWMHPVLVWFFLWLCVLCHKGCVFTMLSCAHGCLSMKTCLCA